MKEFNKRIVLCILTAIPSISLSVYFNSVIPIYSGFYFSAYIMFEPLTSERKKDNWRLMMFIGYILILVLLLYKEIP